MIGNHNFQCKESPLVLTPEEQDGKKYFILVSKLYGSEKDI
jgi:hypothetical protein